MAHQLRFRIREGSSTWGLVLFKEYDLLAQSGLFDAAFYVAANPDVATLNLDPLLHYLEQGAREGRNPRPDFDSAFYLEQCRLNGQRPSNPLVHFVTVGAALGLKTQARNASIAARPVGPQLDPDTGVVLNLDQLVLTALDETELRLLVEGWALADEAVLRICALVGDAEVGRAVGRLPRPDVAQAYASYDGADTAGFSITARLPRAGAEASVDVAVCVHLASGKQYRRELSIEVSSPSAAMAAVAEASSPRAAGPAPIRLQIDEAAVDAGGILNLAGWAVCFLDISSVDVFLDDEPLGMADYGRSREDVAAAAPEYPRALHSGFAFSADIGRFGPGARNVRVSAVTQTGVSRELSVPVTIPALDAVPAEPGVFHFHCDQIELSTSGRLVVAGWAVCGTTTDAVALAIDGRAVGLARLGLERADVGNAFPKYSYARNAGFAFSQQLDGEFAQGEHTLTLSVKDTAGLLREVPLPIRAQAAAVQALPSPAAASDGDPELFISLDAPRLIDGAAESPVAGSLSINGWALAREGVAAIEIFIDGSLAVAAQHSMPREDVAAVFPQRKDALHCGFATLIPSWQLARGTRAVSIRLRDLGGKSCSVDFSIQVEEVAEGEGPWSLRRKLSQSEIDLKLRMLAGLKWQPRFCLLLACGADAESLVRARASLASLREQAYTAWHVILISTDRMATSRGWRQTLLEGFADIAERVSIRIADGRSTLASLAKSSGAADASIWLAPLSAGDELGCDALLELSLASGLERKAELLYSDERRHNPVTKGVEAYFKPAWSPDLLLSSNYIGRIWCAGHKLFERIGTTLQEWLDYGDYDLVLRATEAATGIHHLPKMLCRRGADELDPPAAERQALARAMERRGINAEIKKTPTRGIYRVKRKKARHGLVSIIIPTRASRGLIKVCLDTLKQKTAYKNYEIICIENIPADQPEWKQWLRENADVVIETGEAFNWSRYNNLCAAQASGEYLLFLNDDIEVLEADWLDVLLADAARPEVGVVGPQLLYPDRSVQHAGLALTNVMGRARHVFRHAREDDPGYFGLGLSQRNVIAVTGACLLTRRATFDALGGFNEAYNIVNNDLDFCLKSWKSGLLNVYTPHTRLIHHERVSRTELGDAFDSTAFTAAWRDTFIHGDPYLNRNLSRQTDDMTPEREPVSLVCTGHPLFARESIRRILVLKLDHIGDCITALPALRKLKTHFPQARLTVLSARATQMVWSLEPAVDEIIEFNFFHARSQLGRMEVSGDELIALAGRLRPLRFDLAVDLRKSPDTRHVLQSTAASYTAGFEVQGRFPWLDIALEWEQDPKLVAKRQYAGDDLVNLVDAVGAACATERRLLSLPPGGTLSLSPEDAKGLGRKPLVCIHAGAGNLMKAWPLSYFAELIDLLVMRNDVQVALIGGPDEVALSDDIIGLVRHPARVRNLAGKLKLSELPTLLARARLFVGNDSGPKHIAGAIGVPTLGIHSSNIDAREWGPMGPAAVAVRRQTSCSPCYIDKVEKCPRNLTCLRGVGVGDVYQLCVSLLAIGATAASSQRTEVPKRSSRR